MYINIFLNILGSNIAEYAGKHLHKFITARPDYHLGNIEEALKQVSYFF